MLQEYAIVHLTIEEADGSTFCVVGNTIHRGPFDTVLSIAHDILERGCAPYPAASPELAREVAERRKELLEPEGDPWDQLSLFPDALA